MSYPLSIAITLGSSRTGLSLRAQLVDTAGSDTGPERAAGFAEIGQGHYLWHVTDLPVGFRGLVRFYPADSPSDTLAVAPLNPETHEVPQQNLTVTQARIGR